MAYEHIGQMISEILKQFADDKAVTYKSGDSWTSLTYSEFSLKINTLASALIRAGIKPQDTVGIYSANRYEWAATDFACTLIGAVSVPIYATNTKEQARYIIEDAGMQIIFTGDATQYKNIESIVAEGTRITIVAYDPATLINSEIAQSFDDFLETGKKQDATAEIARRQSKIKQNDTSTIIYTSGTTGNPKGVMLCHGNLFHQFRTVDAGFTMTPEDTSLLFTIKPCL